MSLLAVGLAGCTKEASSADVLGREPTIAASPAPVDPAALLLPLDAYRPTQQQQATLQRALSILTQTCMKRFGFDYPVANTLLLGGSGVNARRYLLADPSLAAERGYHPSQELEEADRQVQNRPTLSPAAQAVATGKGQSLVNGQSVPQGGCYGEASRKLVEGTPDQPDTQLADNLAGQSYDRALQHSRVVAVFEAWSACMRQAGFNYRRPQDANNDRVFATEQPSSAEIATAVADVKCKQETNLVGIWAAVEIAYQTILVQQNKPALDAVKARLDVALKNAATVAAAR